MKIENIKNYIRQNSQSQLAFAEKNWEKENVCVLSVDAKKINAPNPAIFMHFYHSVKDLNFEYSRFSKTHPQLVAVAYEIGGGEVLIS